MAKYVIGVDGGTESLRAAVFDLEGRILGSHAVPYDTQYPHPGWAEQRPGDWWGALGGAVRGALAASGVAPGAVAALCVDTTCCTVVALGADGEPLRPALLWMDMRSAAQAARVAAADDPALQVNGGGRGPVSAEWMVPKALWLAEAEPEVYAAAATICEFQDYINRRLTGRRCASANCMAVRWHWDSSRGPPLSLLSKLGIPDLASKWPLVDGEGRPAVLAPGEAVGGLTEEAAAHVGLPPGLLVAQGGADAFIGMLGLGVVEPGQMALLTGSSHLQLGMVGKPLHGAGFFGTYSDAVLPGLHVIEGGQTSTGSVLAWFRRTCCPPGTPYSVLDAEAEAVPPGSEGLVALDHFQGNRTPHTDPLSRGALAGLTLKHGRGHVWRALMEGVAAGTAIILRTMAAAGYAPASIALAGGAANSPLWLQIHADMSGVPLRLTRCSDAPMLGCAILAAVAAGLYGSVGEAAGRMVGVEREVVPSPEGVEAYREPLRRYAALYPALAPIFRGEYDTHTHRGGALAPAPLPSPSPASGPSASAPSRPAASAPARLGPSSAPAWGPPPGPRSLLLAPSLLAADFAALGAACKEAEAAGADWLHVDVFDGSWELCPNFTLGPPVVAALRGATALPLDCHLAVQYPDRHLDALLAAVAGGPGGRPPGGGGAGGVTVHWEVAGPEAWAEGVEAEQRDSAAAARVAGWAARIRGYGLRAGVALAPSTPLPGALVGLARAGGVDQVLILAVDPGFGGQGFQGGVLGKVRELRAACPDLRIVVDGGISALTAPQAAGAGADVLVSGSWLFGHPQGLAAGLAELRAAAEGGAAAAVAP
ncbi:hypothetical protein HYH03_018167 [Edaphochlamys debaryana]|uniref:glycerol kinase n=1 Tax=Edaphochlamys debaryana TaxID=47281 RepID=A0A835XEB4_9CHLO|nr:hypothetical protein HYH03_018167 [Edaphochlamys debaryana]|eukprot:KAG2482942.1 hypothetical protein HYH03_018167 [Edaphochlamys debaryana]